MVRGAIVVGTGSHDNYQFPLALHEGGLLEQFVTDMYWPADRTWFARTAGAVLPRAWVDARHRPGLDSRRVTIAPAALGTAATMKIFPKLQWNRRKDVALGRRAAKIALRDRTPLFAYSYYAGEAFRRVRDVIPQRFLHQIHPHPVPVRAILREELERVPQARFSLLREPDLVLEGQEFAALADEPHLANGWLVASQYSAESLVSQGIPRDRIHVVPYGVDHARYRERAAPPDPSGPFTIMFVGSLSQRKGLSYLLDAVRLLKTRSIRVLLRGRGVVDADLLAGYSDLDFDLQLNLPTETIVSELHGADLFVLPSLTEGFGHVILQALACGVPAITTTHTSGPDLMVDGEHGFIVPIRDPEALAEKLAWSVDHRESLAAMGRNAAARARMFTWERFRAGVRDAYRDLLAATGG